MALDRKTDERSHDGDQAVEDDDNADDREHLIAKEGFSRQPAGRYESKKPIDRRMNRYVMLQSVFLSVACIALSVALFFAIRSDAHHGIPSPIPNMPRKTVKFEENPIFAGPSTQESDQAWHSLTPAGDGFLIIDDPTAYNLPPGKESSKGQVYDISLFHQLHCLANIRKHILLLTLTLDHHLNNTAQIQEILLDPEVPHIYHCLDYIRQGLMCAGDMTVEWPREELDGQRFAFDGWGIAHECKSWDAIMKYMDENDISSSFGR